MFKDKTILISGGTGSWGHEITRQLLTKEVKEIIIFSRGENAQVEMQRKLNCKLDRYVIGDVRDPDAVNKVMSRGIDYVFHAAALKHVPICENYPDEAIKTNIAGIRNVIDAAIKYKVKKFVNISTDKAAGPSNLYGLTKAIAERLTIQANCLTMDTEFINIRTGNVLGSNGSIIPYVIDQIKTVNKVRITDRQMMRFFLTVQQAVELLFHATKNGIGGETYIRKIPAFYIIDLIELLVEFYGDSNTKIEVIGIREGEKINEELITQSEISRTDDINKDYYVIYPEIKTGRSYNCSWYDVGGSMLIDKAVISEDNLQSKEQLSKLLKQGGWLK